MMPSMNSSDRPARPSPADDASALETLGRSSGPASLILSSLADGTKHGYALTKDIESFAGVRLAPGTLYEALSRLEAHGMIEAVESSDRRRPYRLTATGATALSTYSYRLDHTRQQALLAALGTAMLAADLIADAGGDLDLDFHAIMHWGADVALEKNYVPSRSQHAPDSRR